MERLRPHLTPSLLVACLALLVAIGGTSYAAVALPRNSVGATQLKTGAVTSADVKDKSLKAVDFAPRQLKAGPAGPAGSSAASVLTGMASLPAGNAQFSLDGSFVTSSPTAATSLSPAVPTVLRDFSVRLDTPVPAGVGRSFSFRYNATDVPLCNIDEGGTACTAPGPIDIPASASIQLSELSLVAGGGTPTGTTARFGLTIGTT